MSKKKILGIIFLIIALLIGGLIVAPILSSLYRQYTSIFSSSNSSGTSSNGSAANSTNGEWYHWVKSQPNSTNPNLTASVTEWTSGLGSNVTIQVDNSGLSPIKIVNVTLSVFSSQGSNGMTYRSQNLTTWLYKGGLWVNVTINGVSYYNVPSNNTAYYNPYPNKTYYLAEGLNYITIYGPSGYCDPRSSLMDCIRIYTEAGTVTVY